MQYEQVDQGKDLTQILREEETSDEVLLLDESQGELKQPIAKPENSFDERKCDERIKKKVRQLNVTIDENRNRTVCESYSRQSERNRQRFARYEWWKTLITNRGKRYEHCRLKNFEVDGDTQRDVLNQVKEYVTQIADRIHDGQGVFIYGPTGTGKDHIVVALAHEAIRRGYRVIWQNGMDLYGNIRDLMNSVESEKSLVDRLVSPKVLYLSDPLPPIGKLSEFQSSMLFRIIDARYSSRKPTWVTVNVGSREELDERMGTQTADRLLDGSLTSFFNWPSYRKKVEVRSLSRMSTV